MVELGVDLSNWDEIDANTVACFLASGYQHAIIGCQVESIGNQQTLLCQDGGMDVHTSYCFLYFGFDGFMGFQDLIAMETNKAIRVALAHGLSHVSLDCEANGVNARDGVTADERVADWRRARDMVISAGLRPVLYTGSFYWRDYMGDVAFDDPLWLANYGAVNGQQPPPEPIRLVRMGGADHEVGVHQYASLPELCDRDSRDRNFILKPWWNDMTADEVKAIAASVFDSNFSPYFLRAMRQYWLDTGDGDFSDAPDLEVVDGMKTYLGTSPSPSPEHVHTDPDQIPHTHGEAQ